MGYIYVNLIIFRYSHTGDGDADKVSAHYHSAKVLLYLRAFVEAVLEYTKAD